MLTVIIGFVIILASIIATSKRDDPGFMLIVFVAVPIFLFAFCMGGFVNQYTEWRESYVQEIGSFGTTQDGEMIYVQQSANNVYTYRADVNTEFDVEGAKTFEVRNIKTDWSVKVLEIEDPQCTTPVVKILERSTEKSLWYLTYTEKMYIFYVPEGTIIKEVE